MLGHAGLSDCKMSTALFLASLHCQYIYTYCTHIYTGYLQDMFVYEEVMRYCMSVFDLWKIKDQSPSGL